MPNKTTNYGLTKPLKTENYDIEIQNSNMDIIDKGLIPYVGDTSGTPNTYTISVPNITKLATGMAVSLKINVDSTGPSTLNISNLGAIPIKKTNGTDVTNLKAGGIYTLRYDGTNFILQGEGASGNATASDLLLDKTATTDAGEITGTMPNNGAVVVTPGTTDKPITKGYHNGTGYVKGDADLISSNIKAGANIFGVPGSPMVMDTSVGDAVAGNILAGKKACVDGAVITGTMSNYAGISKQNRTMSSEPGYLYTGIDTGYYDSSSTIFTYNANFIPANIAAGVSIFGLAGTMAAGKRFASGTTINSTTQSIFIRNSGGETSGQFIKVSNLNLGFTPRIILYYHTQYTTCIFVYFRDGFTSGGYAVMEKGSYLYSDKYAPHESLYSVYGGAEYAWFAWE